jgi:signal transduction histidine kinase
MALRALSAPWRPPRADAAIAVGLVLVGLTEVWFLAAGDRLPGSLAVLALGLPLAWRRRAPLASALAVFATVVATVLLVVPIDHVIFFIPVLVLALYSLGAYASTRGAAVGLAFALVAVWIATFADEGPGVDNLFFGLVVAGAPWLAGRMVRRRTEQAVTLALHAQELERSQDEREQAAVGAERARIARELHDIIAHSVSVMTIQAGAVETVLDTDPGKARTAAAAIRRTGQQAQTDLRRLLGVLRQEPGEEGGFAPQPGLADLEELVESVRRAGMDVRLDVEGAPRPLQPAVDLSAFRVIQEALTNTLKHGRASTASVGVRYEADVLAIEVVDDGTSAGSDGDGHGLLGMRERLALYGGQLEYGHQPTGGFRVRALLPVDGQSR